MAQIIFLFFGLAAGAVISFLFLKSSAFKAERDLLERVSQLESEKAVLTERAEQYNSSATETLGKLDSQREEYLKMSNSLVQQQSQNEFLQNKLDEQQIELSRLQEKFTKEFENLANKILEEKSQKFTEQNRTNLDIILNPLKERIKEFELKIDTSYKAEAAERNSLKGEIKNLVELNKQISEEANNLAKALKGDTKKQGNWGEIILEKILERSGLVKGQEYDVQVSTSNEEGKRIQPDVVVYLPDEKHLIVDSKVSLVAYEEMVNSTNDEDRESALKNHLLSVRNHIKILSEKNYQSSSDFTSPDFVLLFMPIESSFGLAVQSDNELFNYAWDRKIVIVSPTTLLATLRTISSVWKQEKQTRNALEIARQSGALYDKFKGFLDDLIDVGKRMDMAKSSYSDAMNKLSGGTGNILKRIEDIKKLGAKTSKEIPASLLERSEENSNNDI
ncbi:MAG TPA: DNA recombination protein RmuC [Bacteroidia bacterium]|nr:DNA recombination protein RmuC [Bacteroidia bacterium]